MLRTIWLKVSGPRRPLSLLLPLSTVKTILCKNPGDKSSPCKNTHIPVRSSPRSPPPPRWRVTLERKATPSWSYSCTVVQHHATSELKEAPDDQLAPLELSYFLSSPKLSGDACPRLRLPMAEAAARHRDHHGRQPDHAARPPKRGRASRKAKTAAARRSGGGRAARPSRARRKLRQAAPQGAAPERQQAHTNGRGRRRRR